MKTDLFNADGFPHGKYHFSLNKSLNSIWSNNLFSPQKYNIYKELQYFKEDVACQDQAHYKANKPAIASG